MNLDLEPAQRLLAEAVRKSAATAAASASGWDVFDRMGITDTLLHRGADRAALGQLDWCLVFEEVGAACRDLAQIRVVRTYLDVFVNGRPGPDAKIAADAFLAWSRHWRSPTGHEKLAVERVASQSGDGMVAWRAKGCSSVEFPEVTCGASDAGVIADRDLIACAAYAVGVGRQCLEAAQERAVDRMIAGRPLLQHQGTAHRLAESALDLSLARVGLWLAAGGADEHEPLGPGAPAAVAACVSASLACAHTMVQIFGAAGTSSPEITRLYRRSYEMADLCGSPHSLWRLAGRRWVSSFHDHGPGKSKEVLTHMGRNDKDSNATASG